MNLDMVDLGRTSLIDAFLWRDRQGALWGTPPLGGRDRGCRKGMMSLTLEGLGAVA